MKRNFMFVLLISTLLLLAACGTSTDDAEDPTTSEEDAVVENNEESSDDSEAPEEAEGEEEEEEDQTNNEANDENEEKETITATGTYNGQADPHTIEIETDDGPTAFQLTMEARDDVENLEVGEQVTYTYYEEGEQLVIESIQSSE